MDEEISTILLKRKAVTLSANDPFTWASGIKSPIYTDNRILLSYPDDRKAIINGYLELIKELDYEFDVIAGVATSGIPWASWVAEKLNKPMIYVRAKKKDHGKENLIEGRLENGKKVLVVEDLISTGSSSVSVVQAIRDAGGIVDNCVGIFTYGLEKASAAFSNADCKLVTLTSFSSLVEVASKTGYVTEDEKDKVLSWSKDPVSWKS